MKETFKFNVLSFNSLETPQRLNDKYNKEEGKQESGLLNIGSLTWNRQSMTAHRVTGHVNMQPGPGIKATSKNHLAEN